MPKIEIEVKLSEEDRELLASVEKAAKALGGKPGKPSKSAKDEVEEDDTDTTADDDFGGEADDNADGDGDEAPTKADVLDALRAYAKASSQAAAVKLMKEHGGSDKLSSIKEAKYSAVMNALKAATAKAKKAKK